MQLRGSAIGAFITIGVLIVACSSSPSHPPIDTTGPTSGGSGGGQSLPGDGGVVEDGGTVVILDSSAADAGVSCLTAPCLGCCDNLNICRAGTLNAQCGISGGICSPCPGTQTCIGGACQ